MGALTIPCYFRFQSAEQSIAEELFSFWGASYGMLYPCTCNVKTSLDNFKKQLKTLLFVSYADLMSKAYRYC